LEGFRKDKHKIPRSYSPAGESAASFTETQDDEALVKAIEFGIAIKSQPSQDDKMFAVRQIARGMIGLEILAETPCRGIGTITILAILRLRARRFRQAEVCRRRCAQDDRRQSIAIKSQPLKMRKDKHKLPRSYSAAGESAASFTETRDDEAFLDFEFQISNLTFQISHFKFDISNLKICAFRFKSYF
jgi:hypothetical protein